MHRPSKALPRGAEYGPATVPRLLGSAQQASYLSPPAAATGNKVPPSSIATPCCRIAHLAAASDGSAAGSAQQRLGYLGSAMREPCLFLPPHLLRDDTDSVQCCS